MERVNIQSFIEDLSIKSRFFPAFFPPFDFFRFPFEGVGLHSVSRIFPRFSSACTSFHSFSVKVGLTGGQKVVSSTLIIPTIFLYLPHHSPPDDAIFISRYIPFNPRVVQRMFLSKILRREAFSAPFGCRRTHSSPEILRLRKGSPSRFFELMRKVRADSPTATSLCETARI